MPGVMSAVLVLGAAAVRGAAAQIGPAEPGSEIIVSYPVRVTEPGSGHSFTSIVADPTDAHHLLVCGIRESPAQNSWQGFVYASHDGGAHWLIALVDSSSSEVSEETCAFGPAGSAYFIAQPWDQLEDPHSSHLHLYRSKDYGMTWEGPAAGPWLDYARMAVDNTSGRYRGVIYAFGNTKWRDDPDGSTMELLVSRDSGRTVGSRIRAPGTPTPLRGNFPQQTRVLPDGAILTAYWASIDSTVTTSTTRDREQAVFALTAVAGGWSMHAPVLLTRVKSSRWRQNGIPSLDVDLSDGRWRGQAYVVWDDSVDGRERVVLSKSSDDGATWSTPRVVDDSYAAGSSRPNRGAAHRPSIAVNRDGIVGVIWAEQAGDCWRFTASRDGGRTFTRSVPLNPCLRRPFGEPVYETAPRGGPDKRAGRARGDAAAVGFWISVRTPRTRAPEPFGMTASADGAFHALIRFPEVADLWTTRVQVKDEPTKRTADNALGHLSNVSEQVMPVLTDLSYDDRTGVISADLSLFNKDSVRTIRAPLYLQLQRMMSSFGAVSVIDPDDSKEAVRALWDFTRSLPDGQLLPHRYTRRQRILFRIARHLRSSDQAYINRAQGEDPNLRILRVYAKAFGTPTTVTPIDSTR